MDFAALVDARHSWNHTRRLAHATYLGLLSHVQPPPRGGNRHGDATEYIRLLAA